MNLSLHSLTLSRSFGVSPLIQTSNIRSVSQFSAKRIKAQFFTHSFLRMVNPKFAFISNSDFSHFLSGAVSIGSKIQYVVVEDGDPQLYFSNTQSTAIINATSFQYINPTLGELESNVVIYSQANFTQISLCTFYHVSGSRIGSVITVGNSTSMAYLNVQQFILSKVCFFRLYGKVHESINANAQGVFIYSAAPNSTTELVSFDQFENELVSGHLSGGINYGKNTAGSQHRFRGINMTRAKGYSPSFVFIGEYYNASFLYINAYNADIHASMCLFTILNTDVSFRYTNWVNIQTSNTIYPSVMLVYVTNSMLDFSFLYEYSYFINSKTSIECTINKNSSIVLSNCYFDNSQETSIKGQVSPLGNCVFSDQQKSTYDMFNELEQIPDLNLQNTQQFTASNTFSPTKSANHVKMNSEEGITAGVLATIFGILALFYFSFMVYLRIGATKSYHVVGKYNEKYSESEDGVCNCLFSMCSKDEENSYSNGSEYGSGSEGSEDPKPRETVPVPRTRPQTMAPNRRNSVNQNSDSNDTQSRRRPSANRPTSIARPTRTDPNNSPRRSIPRPRRRVSSESSPSGSQKDSSDKSEKNNYSLSD